MPPKGRPMNELERKLYQAGVDAPNNVRPDNFKVADRS